MSSRALQHSTQPTRKDPAKKSKEEIQLAVRTEVECGRIVYFSTRVLHLPSRALQQSPQPRHTTCQEVKGRGKTCLSGWSGRWKNSALQRYQRRLLPRALQAPNQTRQKSGQDVTRKRKLAFRAGVGGGRIVHFNTINIDCYQGHYEPPIKPGKNPAKKSKKEEKLAFRAEVRCGRIVHLSTINMHSHKATTSSNQPRQTTRPRSQRKRGNLPLGLKLNVKKNCVLRH